MVEKEKIGSTKKIPILPIFSFSVLLFLVLSLYIYYSREYTLLIKNATKGSIILKEKASLGDNLWIVFLNSVENLPVGDHLVVEKGYKIIFTETIYQSPYAGYIYQEKQEIVASRTSRISGLNIEMNRVTFWAGYESKHLLFFNGNFVPLYNNAEGGDLIEIKIEKKSLN